MISKKIDLYAHFGITRPEGCSGYLEVYAHDMSGAFVKNRIRPAMLVLPGGGYGYCSEREKEPIVFNYLANGFNCYCLDYSVCKNAKYPNHISLFTHLISRLTLIVDTNKRITPYQIIWGDQYYITIS